MLNGRSQGVTSAGHQYNQQLQTIAELFGIIESNKETLNIETYTLSQTTLEQVFLSFAREQKNSDPKDDAREQASEPDSNNDPQSNSSGERKRNKNKNVPKTTGV